MLFLCLTRWDLLFDLIALQTQVTNATGQALRDCNVMIARAKRHKALGLVFRPLPGSERRLASVADSSHARKKSSYAFEGNLVLLQPEIDARAQSTAEHQQTVHSRNVPGLSGYVHPLHVKSQKAKRLSQSTSHAETLSQLSVTAVAECVAMRYTEIHISWSGEGCDTSAASLHKGTPTLETLMEADHSGLYVIPVDCYTDCLDLLELTTGLNGVPQDRHQRLAILALRENDLPE